MGSGKRERYKVHPLPPRVLTQGEALPECVLTPQKGGNLKNGDLGAAQNSIKICTGW